MTNLSKLETLTEQLLEAESTLSLFFKSSTCFFMVAGADGYFKKINPAWTNVFGWTLEEMKNTPWEDLVHPDDLDKTIDAGHRMRNGEIIKHFTNRYRTKTGEYRSVLWSCPEFSNGYSYVTGIDITSFLGDSHGK